MSNNTSVLATIQELLGEDFNLSLLISSTRRSIIWFILLLLISSGIVILYLRYTPGIYQSSSQLMLKKTLTARVLGVNDVLADDFDEIQREVQIIKSRLFVERVLKTLPFEISYFKKGKTGLLSTELYRASPFIIEVKNVKNNSIYGKDISIQFNDKETFKLSISFDDIEISESFRLNKFFETEFFEIKILLSDKIVIEESNLISEVYFFNINNLGEYSASIAANINVQPPSPSLRTIEISYKDESKTKVVDIVNALTKELIAYDIERKTESARQILEFLDYQIDTFSVQLAQAQDSLKIYRMKNQFLNPTSELDKVSGLLKSYENQLNELMFKRQMAEWIANYVEQVKDVRQISTVLLSGELEGVSRYLNLISELELTKDELLLEVSTEHPKIKMINNNIDEIRGKFLNDVDNIIKRLDYKIKSIEDEYENQLERFLKLPEKESEFSKLSRDYEIKEKFFQKLLDKKAEIAIAKAGIVSDYLTLKVANEPKIPISPNGPLLWMIALSSALVLGFLIIVIRYFLHSSIISLEDIRRYTSVPILGVIPTVSNELPISSIVVNHNPKSLVSEAFRSLRANLKFIHTESGISKTMAVTSTISGEGKTFIAINFGAIMSFLNKKVIILDLDMRRPRLSAIFNVENTKGMSTILINSNEIDECIYKTNIENLHFISSGPIPPNPAELILSTKFQEVITYLKQKYDYIIIDTPPIGLVTDGLEIIKNVDYPLYVFRADYSNKTFSNNVNKLVEENNVKHLSLILNDFGRGVSGYYYGYGGYGYSYSYTYGGRYYSESNPEVESTNKGWFKKN